MSVEIAPFARSEFRTIAKLAAAANEAITAGKWEVAHALLDAIIMEAERARDKYVEEK